MFAWSLGVCIGAFVALGLSFAYHVWWFPSGGPGRWNCNFGSAVYALIAAGSVGFLVSDDFSTMILWFLATFAFAALAHADVLDDYFRAFRFAERVREMMLFAMFAFFIAAAWIGGRSPRSAYVYTSCAAALLLSAARTLDLHMFRFRYTIPSSARLLVQPAWWPQPVFHALTMLAHVLIVAALCTRDAVDDQVAKLLLVLAVLAAVVTHAIAPYWCSITDDVQELPYIAWRYGIKFDTNRLFFISRSKPPAAETP